jgi:hypothetical protein
MSESPKADITRRSGTVLPAGTRDLEFPVAVRRSVGYCPRRKRRCTSPIRLHQVEYKRLNDRIHAMKSGLRRTENVMDLERLVHLIEPFGTVGRAAAAALIDRQLQVTQQARDLFPRRHMVYARVGAECCLIKVVERGQAARKKFSVHLALGKAIDRAEA